MERLTNELNHYEQNFTNEKQKQHNELEELFIQSENSLKERMNNLLEIVETSLYERENRIKERVSLLEQEVIEKDKLISEHEEKTSSMVEEKYDELKNSLEVSFDKMLVAERDKLGVKMGLVGKEVREKISILKTDLNQEQIKQKTLQDKQIYLSKELDDYKNRLKEKMSNLANDILEGFKFKVDDYQEQIIKNLEEKYVSFSEKAYEWELNLKEKEQAVIEDVDKKFFNIQESIISYRDQISIQIKEINEKHREIKEDLIKENEKSIEALSDRVKYLLENIERVESNNSLKSQYLSELMDFISDSKNTACDYLSNLSSYLDSEKEKSTEIFTRSLDFIKEEEDAIKSNVVVLNEMIEKIKEEYQHCVEKLPELVKEKEEAMDEDYKSRANNIHNYWKEQSEELVSSFKRDIEENTQKRFEHIFANLEKEVEKKQEELDILEEIKANFQEKSNKLEEDFKDKLEKSTVLLSSKQELFQEMEFSLKEQLGSLEERYSKELRAKKELLQETLKQIEKQHFNLKDNIQEANVNLEELREKQDQHLIAIKDENRIALSNALQEFQDEVEDKFNRFKEWESKLEDLEKEYLDCKESTKVFIEKQNSSREEIIGILEATVDKERDQFKETMTSFIKEYDVIKDKTSNLEKDLFEFVKNSRETILEGLNAFSGHIEDNKESIDTFINEKVDLIESVYQKVGEKMSYIEEVIERVKSDYLEVSKRFNETLKDKIEELDKSVKEEFEDNKSEHKENVKRIYAELLEQGNYELEDLKSYVGKLKSGYQNEEIGLESAIKERDKKT